MRTLTLFLIALLFLAACQKPNTEADLIEVTSPKAEKIWFNLYLPPQVLYELKPEALGLEGPFSHAEIKDINHKNLININVSPQAIQFYYGQYNPEIEYSWVTVKTKNQETRNVKLKMFAVHPLDVDTGETNDSPDFLTLKGIDLDTSTWTHDDINIGWTHAQSFDPELSGSLIYYHPERYNTDRVDHLSIKDSMHYNAVKNIWTITKADFLYLTQGINNEAISLSFNLVSRDFDLAKEFTFEIYKPLLEKKHLVLD